MQKSDTGEVVQVAGQTQAHARLQEGWMLLAVVPNQNAQGRAHVAYALSKPRKNNALGMMVLNRLQS